MGGAGLSCAATSPCFFFFKIYAIFFKGDNLYDHLFVFLGEEALPKTGLLLNKEFAPTGANSSFKTLRVDPC